MAFQGDTIRIGYVPGMPFPAYNPTKALVEHTLYLQFKLPRHAPVLTISMTRTLPYAPSPRIQVTRPIVAFQGRAQAVPIRNRAYDNISAAK